MDFRNCFKVAIMLSVLLFGVTLAAESSAQTVYQQSYRNYRQPQYGYHYQYRHRNYRPYQLRVYYPHGRFYQRPVYYYNPNLYYRPSYHYPRGYSYFNVQVR
ncbi:MAG: hypothetical protein AAFN77_21535 [Planctomycetota bacterium]